MQKCKRHPSTTTTTSSSPASPLSELRRLLTSRDERERTGRFFADGLRPVVQALNSPGTRIEQVILAPELLKNPLGENLRERLRAQRIPETTLSASLYRQLSNLEEPQGIGVIVQRRPQRLSWLAPTDGAFYVALDTIRSPGNLGTILRTMDAVGASGLILMGGEVDPFDPRVVRATMGSLFAQKIVRTTAPEFAAWRTQHGVVLVGTSPHAATSYRAFDWPQRTVLWLGGEREGLSQTQQAACDAVVRIPMVGTCDSLNVATAAAVLLYEVKHFHDSSQPYPELPRPRHALGV